MKDIKVFDRFSIIVLIAMFILSLYLFFHDTRDFYGSVFAAAIAAGVAWATYVVLRWLVLAWTR